MLINVVGKELPFKGYTKKYRLLTKDNPDGNLVISDKFATVRQTLQYVSDKRPFIDTVVIDDAQYLMANEFMRRAYEQGYSKFTQIGEQMWSLLDLLPRLRSGLTVVFMFHEDADDTGKKKAKTIGRLLDDKITVEGLFSIVLHARVHYDPTTDTRRHEFVTQSDGTNVAKTPRGMFETTSIPNDLNAVMTAISEYYDE